MPTASLLKGTPGHPLHPPLTDVTIGGYAVATLCGILGALGVSSDAMTSVWWIALLVGLGATVPTAATGLLDWLGIARRTPLWRTATAHLAANVAAAVLFGLAAWLGHERYADGVAGGAPLGLTIGGFALLTTGGWLGGTMVYVHGMRVLGDVELEARHAVSPDPRRASPER